MLLERSYIKCYYTFLTEIKLYMNKMTRLFSVGNPNKNATIPRLVGGHEVDIAEFPYMVSVLDYRYNYSCGGALISDIWVLTSGHCVFLKAEAQFVRIGSTYCEDGGVTLQVVTKILHPQFGKSEHTRHDDIALLKLNMAVKYETVKPIKISSKLVVLPGANVFVAGWGVMNGIQSMRKLRVVQMKVHASEICLKKYGNEYNSKVFCAGDDKHDSCEADSGGPVVIGSYLVGLVIYGNGCGDTDFPGLYTKIEKYVSWIKFYTGLEGM